MRTLTVLGVLAIGACHTNGAHQDVDAGAGSADGRPVDGPADGGTLPLVAGHFTLQTDTLDGHVVVFDASAAASAVDEVTGTVSPIATGATRAVGLAKAALVWSGATLHVWTAAHGAKQLATAATGTATASDDGLYVAYYDGSNGTTADLYLDRTDSDAPHKLLAATDVGPGCSPRLGFVGGRLIASHCEGGAATVTSWNPADQTHVELLASGYSAWSADPAGTRVFVLDLDDHGSVIAPTGGTATPIGTDIARARFTASGNAIIYRTHAGGMFRVAAGGGIATTLQTTGVVGIYAISPDSNAVLFASGFDDNQQLSDLKLTSATQNDAVVTLNSTKTSGFMGIEFSADSRYALYGFGIDPNYFVGSMYAAPVAGGAPRQLAAGVDVWYALGPHRVVFDDHFTPGGSQGTADLELVDLDGTAAPTKLADQIAGLFFLSTDATTAVVATETGPGGAGIYRVALP